MKRELICIAAYLGVIGLSIFSLRRRVKPFGEVENPEAVSPFVLAQMERAEERLEQIGAKRPFRYIGAGMEGIVVSDAKNRCYKVARHENVEGRRAAADESEFLQDMARVPELRAHVVEVLKHHHDLGISERVCVIEDGERSWKDTATKQATKDLFQNTTRKHGWTNPEQKDDSYIIQNGVPVLVDGGFAQRIGQKQLDFIKRALRGEEKDIPHWQDEAWVLYTEVLDKRVHPLAAREVLQEMEKQGLPVGDTLKKVQFLLK